MIAEMPLTEEQIQRLIDRISELDKTMAVQMAVLGAQVKQWQDISLDAQNKLAVIWDWKNQVNGSVRIIKWLQAIVLAVVGTMEVWRQFHH